MSKILYFPDRQPEPQPDRVYEAFLKHAARRLQNYAVDDETIRIIYVFLTSDDAIHALKELRPYMGMDLARDMVIELNAWLRERT